MIYHITTHDAAFKAQETGRYVAPSLETEGFIHCSNREQILKVANAFYRGTGDLVILCIDDYQLTSALQWEDAAHPNLDAAPDTTDAEQFPHIYGAIGLQAIVEVVDFPEGEDGFTLPDDLP